MNVEKRGTGYRVQKQYNGKRYSLTFDHKPTQKEIMEQLMLRASKNSYAPISSTFGNCAESYISAKSNVLSASTIRGYDAYLRNLPEAFRNTKMGDIDTQVVQRLINEYAHTHSPKYTKNICGFVLAVFRLYYPERHISITLPQKKAEKDYIPSSEDVRRIFKELKGTDYEIPILLAGCCGLRRSEICSLRDGDLVGNVLTINKAIVQNNENEWILKQTKTDAGVRTVTLPDYLADLIRQKGFYHGHPSSILKCLHRIQDRLEIPYFSLHKLRHYFASYSHTIGVPDKYIMEAGGWKSKNVLDSIYQHTLSDRSRDIQKQIADSMTADLL